MGTQGQGPACNSCDCCSIKKGDVAILFWALALMNLHVHVCVCNHCYCGFNCHREAAVQLFWFPLGQAGTGVKLLGSLIKQCSQVLPNPLLQPQQDLNAKYKDNTQAKSDLDSWRKKSNPNLKHLCQTDKTTQEYALQTVRQYSIANIIIAGYFI